MSDECLLAGALILVVHWGGGGQRKIGDGKPSGLEVTLKGFVCKEPAGLKWDCGCARPSGKV